MITRVILVEYKVHVRLSLNTGKTFVALFPLFTEKKGPCARLRMTQVRIIVTLLPFFVFFSLCVCVYVCESWEKQRKKKQKQKRGVQSGKPLTQSPRFSN